MSLHQLKSKNNSPVLLFKLFLVINTLFSLSVATNGVWFETQKTGTIIFKFYAVPEKFQKIIIIVRA